MKSVAGRILVTLACWSVAVCAAFGWLHARDTAVLAWLLCGILYLDPTRNVKES